MSQVLVSAIFWSNFIQFFGYKIHLMQSEISQDFFSYSTYLVEISLSGRIANLFSAKTIDYIALGRTLLL